MTELAFVGTGLYGPEPLGDKVMLVGAQWIAADGVGELVGELKDKTDRDKPDAHERGYNGNAMPSGHGTGASFRATVAQGNLNRLQIDPIYKRNLHHSFTAMAMMTGYARVEGEKHWPSDVIVGYGLGNFLGLVSNKFIALPIISRDTLGIGVSIPVE